MRMIGVRMIGVRMRLRVRTEYVEICGSGGVCVVGIGSLCL